MATLRLRLERWFSDITESYFLRATVEVAGSTPPGIIDSLKIRQLDSIKLPIIDIEEKPPEQLVGFCTRSELESFPVGGAIHWINIPDYDGSWSGLVGTFVEVDVADIPAPWQELGLTSTFQYEILSKDQPSAMLELKGEFPCGVKPIRYTLVTPAFTGVDGFPTRERLYYPHEPYVRERLYVAPYDDLAGVLEMVETLKTGAQALVDEWNEYETNYEGLDLEIFE